jgi:hypothetical protein
MTVHEADDPRYTRQYPMRDLADQKPQAASKGCCTMKYAISSPRISSSSTHYHRDRDGLLYPNRNLYQHQAEHRTPSYSRGQGRQDVWKRAIKPWRLQRSYSSRCVQPGPIVAAVVQYGRNTRTEDGSLADVTRRAETGPLPESEALRVGVVDDRGPSFKVASTWSIALM